MQGRLQRGWRLDAAAAMAPIKDAEQRRQRRLKRCERRMPIAGGCRKFRHFAGNPSGSTPAFLNKKSVCQLGLMYCGQ